MAIVTTGFFDGVHLGHRHVISSLVSAAEARGEESVVVTFWPHPRTVLQDGARELRLLTSLQEKKQVLAELGVDKVQVLEFSREFSRLTVEEYLKEYVIGRFNADTVLIGYDNRFGNASESCNILETAEKLGLEVLKCSSVDASGIPVSSTRIRQALESGRVEQAAAMLGRPYELFGVVIGGNRIGRTLGFPTANMNLYEPLKLVPANGVYLTEVRTLGKSFYGMTNIGTRPTIGKDSHPVIETHIFDFDEQIYGLDIRIRLLRKIRDEKHFDSLDLLREQLLQDEINCLKLI